MILLSESYKELLVEEEARVMLLQQAIKNKWVCTIRYYHNGFERQRDVEPVAMGYSKSGNLVVRAWQIKGDSKTPLNVPNWRLFRVDGIKVTTRRVPFTKKRPHYNPNGDKTMRQVLIMAKF